MLRPAEERMLFLLARDYALPKFEIVDAGAFIGGSARALAAGLDARPDREKFFKSVHSYDLFLANSDFYRRYLHASVVDGGSFLPMFLHNTRTWSDFINVYRGDFTTFRWIGKPISLLFSDIEKTTALGHHLWTEFAPWLVVGESIFVEQDFVHTQAPHVHVLLGSLEDHFNFDVLVTPSLVLRFRQALDLEVIAEALERAKSGSFEAQAVAVDRLAARVGALENREADGTLMIIKGRLALQHKLSDECAKIIDAIRREYGDLDERYFQARIEDLARRLAAAANA